MKVAVLVITTVTLVMVVRTDAESYVSQLLIVQNRQVSPTSMCWDLVASFATKVSNSGQASVFGQFLYDCLINNGSTGTDPTDKGFYRIQLYKDPFSGAS